jgi:hypothetical protein
MISLARIRRVSRSGDDWDWAERIKTDLCRKRRVRAPFYITGDELSDIVSYKLREQEGRTAKHRALLDDAVVIPVSEAAFKLELPRDADLETAVRIGALSALPGIGIGVASAVLALAQPEQYAIIDWRGWRQVFGEDRETFTWRHYCSYLREVRRAAHQLRWHPQVVDWCLWNIDRAA